MIHERAVRFADAVGAAVCRLIRLEERFPRLFLRIHLKLIALHGPAANVDTARQHCHRSVALTLLAFVLIEALGAAAQDSAIMLSGAVLAGFVPFYRYRNLERQIKRKKQKTLLELPELLSKLTLMVNAGETVQKALKRCLDKREEESVLYRELLQTVHEMDNNISFQTAMENFSKRCGIQEVSLFTNTILLNYRRGGDDFVTSLRDLNRQLWEKRKSLAKTLGEEASSKLVFPMVVVFLVVTVIVAAPAVMLMNQF
jgi:tight adherence protein C